MQRFEVVKQLKDYISFEVLNGKSEGLNESTPLLEWGILNSFELVRIMHFVQNQFHIQVPFDKVVAEYFQDINSIANLVLDLAEQKITRDS